MSVGKLLCIARCNDGTATPAELDELGEYDREITYETFARHVDIDDISEALGYALPRSRRGLKLKKDWHVRFYRSRFRGRPCYHLDWSAIDHIFQIDTPERRN